MGNPSSARAWRSAIAMASAAVVVVCAAVAVAQTVPSQPVPQPKTQPPVVRPEIRPDIRPGIIRREILRPPVATLDNLDTLTRLPVFELAAPNANPDHLLSIASVVGPNAKLERDTGKRDQALAFRSGDIVADVDQRSGGVFVADLSKLWNPEVKAEVPNTDQARQIADRFMDQLKLLPASTEQIRFAFLSSSETGAGQDLPGSLDRRILNRQLSYGPQIQVRNEQGQAFSLPVVGGGGQLQVSVGDGGQVVGYSGVWRQVTRVVELAPVIPRARILEAFNAQAGQAKYSDLRASLAYYSAPAFESQKVLAPVWVVTGTVTVGEDSYPLRQQIIAATQYGPIAPRLERVQPRPGNLPTPNPERRDETAQRGALDKLFNLVLPKAHANAYECGTSWVGASQGLPRAADNRRGFLDRCRSGGWTVNFDWGDNNAFESDWRRNDDSWVDAADLVFYTGHASPSNWNVVNPDDTRMSDTEVGGASDLYGQNDLEWLIIAACGPHQSNHFVGGVGNAFDRWRSIFDGLHSFLGYGAVTFDTSDEGRRFMELAQSGWGVVDAWFRTAQEIQPATNGWAAPNGTNIFVTAMYAHSGDHCARNERLWGYGASCSDVPPGASQQRYLMWSGT